MTDAHTTEDKHLGHRWGVARGYGTEKCNAATKKEPHGRMSISTADLGEPDCYIVTDVYGDDEHEKRFTGKTAERRAERYAEERNRFDVQGPLDPEFAERRKRLNKVRRRAEMFYLRYAQWGDNAYPPNRPERYAAVVWSERYTESFCELYNSLSELKEHTGSDLIEVYDLDTGENWTAKVTVTLE